jgi:hypothetical protein
VRELKKLEIKIDTEIGLGGSNSPGKILAISMTLLTILIFMHFYFTARVN